MRGANYDAGILREANDAYEIFRRDNPESERLPEVAEDLTVIRDRLAQKLYTTGMYYVKRGRARAAAIYLRKLVNSYGETEWGALGSEELQRLAPALGEATEEGSSP